jgi:hypothetical protein
VTTKSWTTLKDKSRAGKLIDKGYLYKLFQNPVFIGIAAYKGQHFAGEHEAILDRAVWEAGAGDAGAWGAGRTGSAESAIASTCTAEGTDLRR